MFCYINFAMPKPAIREDGRHARKARTRQAIVSALLELLDEGVPEPTAAQIAERAGVAVRSIAQHFRTREQLMLAIASQHVARQPEPAKKADGPPSLRLEDFVSARVHELESSRAIRRAASRAADSSDAIATALADVSKRRRAALAQVLGKELARRPPWVKHAVETLTSGAAWDVMRNDQRLSVNAAETLLVHALKHLLEV
jgi:TetR/AcrR family transcriptional regulator, regulator of autoinduction and epiphytic fitness